VPREGRIEAIFETLFSRFSLFRYSLDFTRAVTASWGRIWKKKRRFFSSTCPSPITSFSFFPGVIIEEKHTSVRTPFSQKTGSTLYGRQGIHLQGTHGSGWRTDPPTCRKSPTTSSIQRLMHSFVLMLLESIRQQILNNLQYARCSGSSYQF
jgi:hypothetical protein